MIISSDVIGGEYCVAPCEEGSGGSEICMSDERLGFAGRLRVFVVCMGGFFFAAVHCREDTCDLLGVGRSTLDVGFDASDLRSTAPEARSLPTAVSLSLTVFCLFCDDMDSVCGLAENKGSVSKRGGRNTVC